MSCSQFRDKLSARYTRACVRVGTVPVVPVFNGEKSGSESFTRWLVGCEGFSLQEVILGILFLCSRVTLEQGRRAVLTSLSFSTNSQCKKIELVPL